MHAAGCFGRAVSGTRNSAASHLAAARLAIKGKDHFCHRFSNLRAAGHL
jgi:hypothetical protein